MSETIACCKCANMMGPGPLKERALFGPSPYQWVPLDGAPFPLKGAPSNRYDIVIYRCENCGHLELYAPPTDKYKAEYLPCFFFGWGLLLLPGHVMRSQKKTRLERIGK